MVEFRQTQIALLLLQCAAVSGHHISITVRAGDNVPLPCEDLIDGQHHCNGTSWFVTGPGVGTAVQLVNHGQFGEHAEAKSARLSISEDCSLLIKNAKVEDVGLYQCQQLKHGQPQDQDTQVDLSFIHMNDCEDGELVTLSCSVLTYDWCRHTVKWMYAGKNEDENINTETSSAACMDTMTFPASTFEKSKYRELFTCEVTDGFTRKVQPFHFSPQSSGEKPDAMTASAIRTTESSAASTPHISTDAKVQGWWLYVIVAVGVVVLVIIFVAVLSWKRTKANRTQTDDETADPEDGVSYASVSYTKKTNSKARVQVKSDDDDDEGDAVTYSSVKASSSSAAAAVDPSELYPTVHKPKK